MTTLTTATAKDASSESAVTLKRPQRSERLDFRITEDEHNYIEGLLQLPPRSHRRNERIIAMLFRKPILRKTNTDRVVKDSLKQAILMAPLQRSQTTHTLRPITKSRTLHLRLTKDELNTLQEIAAEHLLSVEAYCRRQLTGTDIREIRFDDVDAWSSLPREGMSVNRRKEAARELTEELLKARAERMKALYA